MINKDNTEDETNYMCPNCCTPWKCNGIHLLPEETTELDKSLNTALYSLIDIEKDRYTFTYTYQEVEELLRVAFIEGWCKSKEYQETSKATAVKDQLGLTKE